MDDKKTLRDEFAMAVLSGALANSELADMLAPAKENFARDFPKAMAAASYAIADAMLEARKTETNNCNGNGEG